jgi:Tol biopolymer transport system component
MTNKYLKLIIAGVLAGTLVLHLDWAGRARALASDIVPLGDTTPTWSPTGDLIAFVSTREIKPEVYTMNADGTGQRRLTSSPPGVSSSAPVWSPDGRRIAFVTGTIGVSQIYIMNADGSDQQQVVSGRWNRDPAWSPDGVKIAFVSHRAGDDGIVVIPANGGQPTSIASELPSVTGFSWSPDSKRIAFATYKYHVEKRMEEGGTVAIAVTLESRIYVVDADGRNRRTLTTATDETISRPPRLTAIEDIVGLNSDRDPQFSPDGNHVAFVSTQKSSQIFVMNLDGSGRRQLTFAGKNQGPVWSPDGRRIAFASDREGLGQIFIMNADGDNQRRLTGSGESRQLSWSPDSQRIVYSAKRGELWGIFRVNADGTGETQLTVGQ